MATSAQRKNRPPDCSGSQLPCSTQTCTDLAAGPRVSACESVLSRAMRLRVSSSASACEICRLRKAIRRCISRTDWTGSRSGPAGGRTSNPRDKPETDPGRGINRGFLSAETRNCSIHAHVQGHSEPPISPLIGAFPSARGPARPDCRQHFHASSPSDHERFKTLPWLPGSGTRRTCGGRQCWRGAARTPLCDPPLPGRWVPRGS